MEPTQAVPERESAPPEQTSKPPPFSGPPSRNAAISGRPDWLRYGTALVSVVVATLLRMALTPLVGLEAIPFLTYFPAVVVSAWVGGLKPGALSAILGAGTAAFFFLSPRFSWEIVTTQNAWSIVIFLVTGLIISFMGEAQRAARQNAEESAQKTTRILESITDAFVALDREWRFTYVNEHAVKVLRKSRNELLGKSIGEVFPEAVDSPDFAHLQQQIGERKTIEQELFSPTLNAWVNFHLYPTPEGMTVYFQDITTRKKAEAERQRSAELLSITLRSIGDAVISTDHEGHIHFLNQVAETLTGWTEAEAQGCLCNEVFRIINEQSRLEVESPVERVLREGQVVGLANHTLLIARDGTERSIDDSGAPIRDADGNLIGVVLVFRDITERRQAEEVQQRLLDALQNEGAKIDRLISSVPGVVWEAWGEPDLASQRIGYVSSYVETLLGYTREEWLATPNFWLTIVHPEDREEAARVAHEAYVTGVEHTNTFRWISKDGRAFWMEAHSVVVKDKNRRPVGMRGVTMDITERRRAQEEREHLLLEIQALNQRLQRAMSETHHRVKNNLQVISALVNLQEMQHPESVPVAELSRLNQHIQSLATIHDLLTQQAKTDATAEDISIQSALERLMPVIQVAVSGRNLRFHAEDVRLPIRYGTSLVALVNELVSNAVKHGEGDIDVSFTVARGQGVLEVKDGGSGFPADFDPRTSAHTGLELIESLSRWDLKGTPSYENHPDGGARIVIEFPLPV